MSLLIRNLGKLNTIVLFAGIITASLFYVMQLLIMTETEIPAPGESRLIEIFTLPELDFTPDRPEPRPEKPEEPPEIPEPTPRIIEEGPPTIAGPVLIDDIPLDVGEGIGFGPTDSNAMPIAQIQPQYPAAAIARQQEGFVIVEFDVSETGNVINPEILVSVPEGVFDRASLRALERWRYQPKVIDGRAVPMRGLQTKFNFSLRE